MRISGALYLPYLEFYIRNYSIRRSRPRALVGKSDLHSCATSWPGRRAAILSLRAAGAGEALKHSHRRTFSPRLVTEIVRHRAARADAI